MISNMRTLSNMKPLISRQPEMSRQPQFQQLSAARVVCGFLSRFWRKRRLLNQVDWLSVRQLIFYHTLIQTHKTITTRRPQTLFRSFSTNFPHRTRRAVLGQIREHEDFSHSTFKYRAREVYNRIPADIRTGSIQTVKKKVKLWIKANVPID